MTTPNLDLTLLEAAQSQKHVTVNEAFVRLDAGVQLSVLDRDLADPPADPLDGGRYLVAAPATGAWLMQENRIAVWDDPAQGWLFLTPQEGWRVWVADERVLLVRDGSLWTPLGGAQLGVNASADETNRLAVASDAILLTHDGAGIQAKLNKAAVADTASVLFQSNYSGRAEIGLAGDDDFHLKTSSDGLAFHEAMSVEAGSGLVRFPSGALIGGVDVSRDAVVNLLPDSGRFGGTDRNAELTLPSFVAPDYISGYNGTSITDHARFIHNTSTHGGSAGSLNAEIDSLHTLLRPPGKRRYGPEWWSMELTQGSGTAASKNVGGTSYYLSYTSAPVPTPKAYSTGFYLRVISGAVLVNQDNTSRAMRWTTDITGDLGQGVIAPPDGWVFFGREMTHSGSGYNHLMLSQHAVPGSVYLLAMPRVVFGHVELDAYATGPLPNDRCFGG